MILFLIVPKKSILLGMQEQPQVMTSQWKAEEKTLEIDGVMLTGNKSFKGKLEADKNKLLGKKKININTANNF